MPTLHEINFHLLVTFENVRTPVVPCIRI